jgi:pSer/pThr/pTyr-binding forkhead associated (FHA) protein
LEAERSEIGVVCGSCDQFNLVGTAQCSSCSNDLGLVPRRTIAPRSGSVAPVQPSQAAPAVAAVSHAAPAPAQAAPEPVTASPKTPAFGQAALPPADPAPAQAEDSSRKGAPTQPQRRGSALAMMGMRSNPPAARSAMPSVAPGAPRAPKVDPRAEVEGLPPGASVAAAPVAAAPVAAAPVAAERLSAPASAPSSQGSRAPESPLPAAPSENRSAGPVPDFSKLSQEELMEQARHYVCRSCSSGVPMGHKFCGRCGEAVPNEVVTAQVLFFGDMQNPAKAKLILIRGEGMDGLSFHLKAEQHIVGRDGQLPFPDDPFVSRRHANFFYRNGKLVVRDEGSLNGVYIRVRGSVEIVPGDTVLAGEQLFRLDLNPRPADGAAPDGTYFYSSPKHPSSFRLAQILQGGSVGMTVCARGNTLQIGREGGDLNFPGDLYMSGSHCRIEESEGHFTLSDLSSRNGTYLRLKTERELGHGDYLFIGRKLLRVELNTN